MTVTALPYRLRMGWRPWRALRERSEIEFALTDLPEGVRAIHATDGRHQAILVSRRLSPADRLAALAHELVHVERGGSGHRPGAPAPLAEAVALEEQRVDRIVARRLVPSERLLAFVDRRLTAHDRVTAADVAEEFDVPIDVAERAMTLARQEGRVA